jgi:hypothetical protein
MFFLLFKLLCCTRRGRGGGEICSLKLEGKTYILNRDGNNIGLFVDDKTGRIYEWNIHESEEELRRRRQPEKQFQQYAEPVRNFLALE